MKVPILFYHKISQPNPKAKVSALYVTPYNFRRQMRYLKWRGYKTISLYELLNWLDGTKKLPSKSIILTFDDGYEDNYTYAFPILKEFRFSATIFLITKDIGGLSGWINSEETIKEPLLSWDKIKEMANYGIDFQPHTHTHPSLPKLDKEKIKKELVISREIIEKQLGKKADFLCYPYGHFNSGVQQILKEVGYKCALTTKRGIVKQNDNLYALNRIGIKDTHGLFRFIRYVEFKYR
ncbi:MAG: polysaccharide deacetylase family protein [Candidatus Omnitrophica bacterium]|nr:polysaccharide deacetylase family protein [Candidatus Omnitrophota bacterium]MBU1047799.1 polysaccharide deacetylase family protein [Candidatus Omnitrophota bacterium]MBU1631086.1 polysaccharide deacetylase family protein [Candidatus Omnitrophota bacterium]MBU1767150.1 polysaccharide deacetylase family protein [Candidatus Omnitrophota bacterium]MBU1889353.1 polysaccharide deacetylase family protein [Candidatus Omnitrophota bacterium]